MLVARHPSAVIFYEALYLPKPSVFLIHQRTLSICFLKAFRYHLPDKGPTLRLRIIQKMATQESCNEIACNLCKDLKAAIESQTAAFESHIVAIKNQTDVIVQANRTTTAQNIGVWLSVATTAAIAIKLIFGETAGARVVTKVAEGQATPQEKRTAADFVNHSWLHKFAISKLVDFLRGKGDNERGDRLNEVRAEVTQEM